MDKSLMRKKDEIESEYIKRIVYGKLIDKTIKDNYEDLSELVFGEGNCYNESEVRKRFYGIKRLLEVLDEENINIENNDKKLNELNMKIIELEKGKIRFQDQKREFKKIAREWGRAEHIYDEIIKAINNMEPIKQLKVNHIFDSDYNKEGLLILSDWHVGLSVSNYWNEFNKDILFKRINKLLNKTIEI